MVKSPDLSIHRQGVTRPSNVLSTFFSFGSLICWLKRISNSCRAVTLNGSLIHPWIKWCLHPSHVSLSRNLDFCLLPSLEVDLISSNFSHSYVWGHMLSTNHCPPPSTLTHLFRSSLACIHQNIWMTEENAGGFQMLASVPMATTEGWQEKVGRELAGGLIFALPTSLPRLVAA